MGLLSFGLHSIRPERLVFESFILSSWLSVFHTSYPVFCLFSQTSRFLCNSVSEAALVFWRFHLVCFLTVRTLKCHQSIITSSSASVNSTLGEFGVASLLVALKACGRGCQSDSVPRPCFSNRRFSVLGARGSSCGLCNTCRELDGSGLMLAAYTVNLFRERGP